LVIYYSANTAQTLVGYSGLIERRG